MISITPVSREQMEANWARVQKPRPEPTPPPRPLNLKHVLDLGNTVFYTFRGRAYGVPPLAWEEGEKIMDAWHTLREIGNLDSRDKVKPYYKTIRHLQKLLWANCKPVGPIRRFLKWLGVFPNPLRRATEGELVDLAVFMLGRRMIVPPRTPGVVDNLSLGTS